MIDHWIRIILSEALGRALIADVVARSARRGVAAVEVTANPRALDFYRKVGFRDQGPVPTRFPSVRGLSRGGG